MNNLAVCYKNGEGIEKNLEKAFYWYQKTAENGVKVTQFNLATLYLDGERTEKNLEMSIYWLQKAAENKKNIDNNHGENLRIRSHLIDKITPTMRFMLEPEKKIYNICNECRKRRRTLRKYNQICIVCYQANLLNKPSGNKIIDEFVKYTQINFVQESSRMKFFPYNQFKNIEFINEGGFSRVYKAIWVGPPYWNEEKEDFEYRDYNITVALKQLKGSENITFKELNEVYCFNLINDITF